MSEQTNTLKKLINSALQLAADQGWNELAFDQICAHADIPLSQAYPLVKDKAGILAALSRQIDMEMLDQPSDENTQSVRDTLFDVLMNRFDAMAPYKLGLIAVANDTFSNPLSSIASWQRITHSMHWAMEAADLDTKGVVGTAKAKTLAGIYLDAFKAWLKDDSEDLATTMKSLDQGLAKAEKWAKGWNDLCQDGLKWPEGFFKSRETKKPAENENSNPTSNPDDMASA